MFGLSNAFERKEWGMRKTILVLMLGLVLVFAAAGCGGGDDESSGTTDDTTATETETSGSGEEAENELYASVGPGFEISLTTEDGEDVTSLAPGSYTVEVDDKSDQHNFHMTGPGVDVKTEVSEVGKVEWDVDLEDGTYEFVCDPHASSMNGSFDVSG
jgi:plastocyanin